MPSLIELIDQLGSDDSPTVFAAYRQIGLLASQAGVAGQETAKADLAKTLAGQLNSPVKHKRDDGTEAEDPRPARGRRLIARLLADVAGQSEVAALVAALGDFAIREEIRWALSRIVAPGATEALVTAAKEGIGPEFRVGAINALATREGEGVLATLKHCALDEDVEVRNAAAEALSRFADPACDQVLSAVLKFGSPTPRTRTRLIRTRLRLAETLAKNGKTDAAKTVYQAVIDQGEAEADAPQIAAARRALEALA